MAQLPHGNFDANTVDPRASMSPDPQFTGWHLMHFTESEMKTTKSGNGQYLQLVAEVLDGPFKGRKLWERLNLVNPSQSAVDIAYRTLSSICHAVGTMNVVDSQQLHNRPFMGNVTYEPANGSNPANNRLTDYKSASAPTTRPQASAPTPAAAPSKQAESQASAPPWMRKAG
jgi:hypothetical protein